MKFSRHFVPLTIILAALFTLTASTAFASGATWVQRTGVGQRYWTGIASSADGIKLVAAPFSAADGTSPDYIYTSTDGGVTWATSTAPQAHWSTVASSADGIKLVAAPFSAADGTSPEYLYYSTDGGATWTQLTGAGQRFWDTVACSADCSTIVAAPYEDSAGNPDYFYTSSDGGATWTQQTGEGLHLWDGAASSADGKRLAVGVDHGYIYTSNDGGTTWTPQTTLGNKEWAWIASSADGMKLAVDQEASDYIYTSTDGGANWATSTAPLMAWEQLTSSADGTKLAAASACDATCATNNDGAIWTSDDGGATWIEQTNTGGRYWYGITSSADGTKLAAVAEANITSSNFDYLYTATLSPSLTTSAASPISTAGATLNGSIDTIGNDNPTTRGYVYGADTSYGATTTESGTFGTGSFTADIASLVCNTAYHFAPYATNGYLGYGTDDTFTTSACPTPSPAPAVLSGGGWSGGCSTYPQGELSSWGVVPCTPTNPSQGPAVSPVRLQSSATPTSSPPSVQSPASTSATQGITLPKNHQLWDMGPDILLLQQFLNAHGYILTLTGSGSPGKETNIFGPGTYQALIKYQRAHNLPPTGYLGPLTRAALALPVSETSTSQ